MAGKRVFICAAASDRDYCDQVVTALDAWEVGYTVLGDGHEPTGTLPAPTERAIRECEVFLRLCTLHTRESEAVNLATDYFAQLLRTARQQGRPERRKLVNLIFDPAYPLDDEERKTLYIMTEGKARALWLEELAVPIGVATLTQRVSRRALLGMGIGATLTLASAGTAGVLLYRQSAPAALPVSKNISGNPKVVFQLSAHPALSNARVFQDGGNVYAQPDLALTADGSGQADSSVYRLTTSTGAQHRIAVNTSDSQSASQFVLTGAAQGLLFLYNYRPGGVTATQFNPSEVRVVNANDGAHRWSIASFDAGPPAASEDLVCVMLTMVTSLSDGNITGRRSLNAFHRQSGAKLWSVPIDGYDFGRIPALAGGLVYYGSFNHAIYCLDGQSGKQRWQYLTRGPVECAPLVAGGLVYCGSDDGNIYALDAHSGALRWHFTTTAPVVATPLLYDGTLYVGSRDAYLYALDAKSGALYWRSYVGVNARSDDIQVGGLKTPPAGYRNVLFTSIHGSLHAFDTSNGTSRWRYIPGKEGDGISPPIISNGLVLIGAADNKVYAVNP